MVVDAVLEEAVGVRHAVEPADVGVVVAEQELGRAFAVEAIVAEDAALHADPVAGGEEAGAARVGLPGPHVAEPELRQHVEARRLGPAIVDRDQHQNVLGRGLGVLDHDVEVAVVLEDAGVDQLELEVALAAAPVLLDQMAIGERRLRILVEELEVGVGRGGVEIVVELLHVLAVVALAVGEAEQALLQDRVLAVPQGERQAQALLVVGDAGDAVLAPAVGAGAGVVVREVVPGIAVRAVVLAHRAPLPLAEIRAPEAPALLAAVGGGKARTLGRQGLGSSCGRGGPPRR